jgi:arylsulfate sulfotransferase
VKVGGAVMAGLICGPMAMAAAPLIVSGPSLTDAPLAPLSCVLELTTDEPTRVILEVDDGVDSWRRDFFRYATVHAIPLAGFKPDRTHSLQISVENLGGEVTAAAAPLDFTTDPLPADFPTITMLANDPARMEPGYTLFEARSGGGTGGTLYGLALNSAGEVIYYRTTANGNDIKMLKNGDFMGAHGINPIRQTDLLGNIVRDWTLSAPSHHDVFPTRHGTLLTLVQATRLVEDYPTSETDPMAPPSDADVVTDVVVELSRETGAILNEWDLLDLLDPRRIGYDSIVGGTANDWAHANALYHDDRDDSVVVSLRHQDAVVKFSRVTGELIWILGPHENWSPAFQPYLFEPVGTPFLWAYHQHAPELTPAGTLLLFDNGNHRASPFDPRIAPADSFSRAVEYELDEEEMQIRQVWEFGSNISPRLFASFICDVDPMRLTGNVLITFGGTRYVDGVAVPGGVQARIIEVTHTTPADIVFEMLLAEPDGANPWVHSVYRSARIFDFYPQGDLDMDRDVDRDDLTIVLRGRNQPALSPLDPRDLDRDGSITALDARVLVTRFYAGGPTE